MMNEPADDRTATKPETEVEPKSVPEEGSDEEFEEAFREPAQNESRKKPETKPEAEPESDSKPKTHPEAKPESKPDKARAVDPNSDTKLTATSGVNRLTVDPAAKAGEFETSKATGSYDATNNNGKWRKKDGSATIDTHRGWRTRRIQGQEQDDQGHGQAAGDIKTLDVVEERKGGGKSEFHGKLAPGARKFEWKDGPDRSASRLGWRFILGPAPTPEWALRATTGPGGTELSAQQRLRAAQNAWFRATVGVEHGGGVTNPSIRLDRDFGLKLPLPGGRKIRAAVDRHGSPEVRARIGNDGHDRRQSGRQAERGGDDMTEALFPTEDLDTILTMIEAAVAFGDEQSTLELCEAARTVAPDDVDVLLTHAAALVDLDQIDDARAALERCVAHHGDIPIVWQRLGELCLDAGDSERAVEAFRQWQRLEGATAENELALAWAYVIDLQLEKARRHLAAADSADDAGEIDDIDELVAELAAIDDQAALESEAGWWLYGRGALDRGLPLLRSSLDRRDDPETRYRLGVALLTSGEFDEAATQLRQAIDAEPATFEWMDDLGTAQLLDGDLDGADATFDRLLVAVPSDLEGLVGSGRVALRRGDPGRALGLADGAIGENPESAEAWTLRATAQLALDQPAEARASAEHAIAFAADDWVAWATAADAADAAGATSIAARYRDRSTLRLSGSLGIAEGDGPVGAEIADELHELDRIVVADPLIREIYRHRSSVALALGPAGTGAGLPASGDRAQRDRREHRLDLRRGHPAADGGAGRCRPPAVRTGAR